MVTKQEKIYKKLAQHLDSDSTFCLSLAAASSESDREAVTAALHHALAIIDPRATLPASILIYHDFLSYCHQNIEELPYPTLISAVLDNATRSTKLRTDRKLFISTLGLNWKSPAQCC
ncbi:hypothetical protein AX14_008014 [Amanita brunnescens Koide BX004]|nr:hypothetical protein AX14_008014 [Amanita brunnescens Koide BX004]